MKVKIDFIITVHVDIDGDNIIEVQEKAKQEALKTIRELSLEETNFHITVLH